jgi:hypothetical protein
MSVVLVGDRFIKCKIMVRHIEIVGQAMIIQVYYCGRVWVVYCYTSITSLTVGCLHADPAKNLQLERQMILCLTRLKRGLCMDVEPLQKKIIKKCRVYFTREQLRYVKTSQWQTQRHAF